MSYHTVFRGYVMDTNEIPDPGMYYRKSVSATVNTILDHNYYDHSRIRFFQVIF